MLLWLVEMLSHHFLLQVPWSYISLMQRFLAFFSLVELHYGSDVSNSFFSFVGP
jgi:hypothetical protein